MFESQTETVILNRMLEKVPASMDKREGSIIFDASMPAAIEFMLLYATLDWFLKNTFGDTAEREYLIETAKERGLSPYPATYAEGNGAFTPADIVVPVGSRFSYDDVNYTVIESSAGAARLRCETAGTAGNKPAGALVPIAYIAGLKTATWNGVIVPGEDEEDTEVFRERYLASFNSQAYGGNIADYREKVNAIEGVGGVKVYPVWNGGGTVRLVFMTSEFKPPDPEFVSEVQTLIDPTQNQGMGIGIAPIGHTVTVQGAQNSAVTIGLNVTFDAGTFEDYKASIEKVIDDYFIELNRNWQNTQRVTAEAFENNGIIIRISQIESRILDIEGVTDIQHTKLNGQEENLTLGVDELAVRGEMTNR